MKQSSWAFVGGYFLFFGGWAAGMVAAVVGSGMHGRPYGADTPLVAGGLAAGAAVLFAVGVQVLARAHWGGISGSPETLVLFILTPIPAVAATVIHLMGRYFRQSDGTLLRVVLLAGGVYLAATTGLDIFNNGMPTDADNPGTFFWPFTIAAGVGLGLLGLVPPARTEPAAEPEPVIG
jgi:hypothetical protein